jgi:hypothetical protein
MPYPTRRLRRHICLPLTSRTDDCQAALLEAVLGLLEWLADLYRQSGPKFCCLLNQAICEKMYVLADEISAETLGAAR